MYVLIIWIGINLSYSTDVSVTTAEFASLVACDEAFHATKDRMQATIKGIYVDGICVAQEGN